MKLVKEKREKKDKKRADDSPIVIDVTKDAASKSREPSLTRGERDRADDRERVRGEKDRQRERVDERDDAKKARYSDTARRDDVTATQTVRVRDRDERREREDSRKVERDLRASSAASSESEKVTDPSPRRRDVDERGALSCSHTAMSSTTVTHLTHFRCQATKSRVVASKG